MKKEKVIEDNELKSGYMDNLEQVIIRNEELLDCLWCIGIGKYPGPDEVYHVVMGRKGGDGDGDEASLLTMGKVPENWTMFLYLRRADINQLALHH